MLQVVGFIPTTTWLEDDRVERPEDQQVGIVESRIEEESIITFR